MPHFDIVKKASAERSYKIARLISTFDLQDDKVTERFAGEIPIDNIDWNIGVIYGASGTGKSTIAKELWSQNYVFQYVYGNKPVVEEINADLKDVFTAFNNVGFSSPPSWLKTYSVLSTGEKMRVDIARAILEERELIVFDEFTSVVDRNVARIGSIAVAKAIRRSNKRFIAVTCHEDVIEYLEPDWTFCTDTMDFYCGKGAPTTKDDQYNSQSNLANDIYGTYSDVIII